MRKFCVAVLIFFSSKGFSQQEFNAIVENETTGLPMSSVHVLNLTKVIGAITNQKGKFEIPAEVSDTLYFSYLGFKPLKIASSKGWPKDFNISISLICP